MEAAGSQSDVADHVEMYTGGVKLVIGYHIVAMPYPGRGHINPMMNLCYLLASKDITVTFVLTEEWLALIGPLLDTPNIRLHSIPNVVPSERTRAADFIGFVNAVYTKMEAPFDRLLDQLELPVSCIVADTLLPWMTAVGSRRNIPVVSLWTMAPSVFAVYYYFDLLAAHRHSPDENLPERREEIIDYLPGVSSMRMADLPYLTVGKTGSVLKQTLEAFSSITKAQAILFTSFYDLQPHVINALRAHLSIPIYAVGPSIPYLSLKVPPSKPIASGDAAYFDWLDSQPEGSVLYVSLGSYLSTSKEQMQELSMGLKDSGVRYLWITLGEVSSLQEMGLIVPWCDQLKVLCHSSVAGFLTHCGWNSTMESIYAGVPMLTFPLFVDQCHNSKLIVEDWRVGLKLKQIVGAEHVVGREEIAQTVKRLMDLNGDEGKELRKRAKELQETCQRAIEIGGSTDNSLNAFVRDVVQGQCNFAN
uniref:Glycosyltransferase n=1 Tax=Davidia involucrata TaxID=16924 RepID=A0A5B7BP67_DAVIN